MSLILEHAIFLASIVLFLEFLNGFKGPPLIFSLKRFSLYCWRWFFYRMEVDICVNTPVVGKEGFVGDSLYAGHVRVGKPGTEIHQILNRCAQVFKTHDRLSGENIWTVPQGFRTSHQFAKSSIGQAV